MPGDEADGWDLDSNCSDCSQDEMDAAADEDALTESTLSALNGTAHSEEVVATADNPGISAADSMVASDVEEEEEEEESPAAAAAHPCRDALKNWDARTIPESEREKMVYFG